MRTYALFCLVVLSAGPALLQAEDKKNDKDKLQGVWEVVKFEQAGEDLDDFVKSVSPTMAFKGKEYTFKGTDVPTEGGEFKLDPKAKTPTVDLTITEGGSKGKKQLGIYKLDGDTLKICLAEEDATTRPSSFKSGADIPERILITMKRKK